ncbi:MAG: LysM peptidoglycan-binding domain-containing protein [Vicinamibacterales bacterium]
MKPTTRLLVVCVSAFAVGCGAHKPAVPVVKNVPPLPVTIFSGQAGTEVPVRVDPSAAVIARAEEQFVAGRKELEAGRMVAAREHFDAAVDTLTRLSAGARGDATVAAAFDQLLDRISALEVLALRDGDGLIETSSEPAALDELLSAAAMFERPQPALTTAETVRADLERTPHDIPIPVNEKVLSFVELFQGRLHDFMEAGLSRGTRYLPMIRKVFQEEGVPLDLAYVPLVESAFKPNALSTASARGMWQFMLGTAQDHGLRQNWFVDERSDPEKATRAAAQYLKTLRNFFDGDWSMALASYNAGPGRIQRAAQKARTGDYWTLTATSAYLPRETREYVPMIMAAMLIAENPSLYGFNVQPANPLAYERVTVPDALDLKILAEWSGVTVEDLREMNPELRRMTTPDRSHELKVPIGTGTTIEQRLTSAQPLFVKFNFHTARKGETLAAIARRYRVSVAELREANDLGARASVRANQELRIPQRPASGLPSAPTRVASAAPRPAAPVTYRVQRGDTLFSIARRFETTVAVIKQLNRLRSNSISVGDRLTLR